MLRDSSRADLDEVFKEGEILQTEILSKSEDIMKKFAFGLLIASIVLFGVSGTAFAKHRRHRHKKTQQTEQTTPKKQDAKTQAPAVAATPASTPVPAATKTA